MRCLRRILGLSWKDKIPNSVILQQAKIQSIYSILSQRRLRWLGHVRRMEDGRIPKDVLYGQLAIGSRRVGRPALRFKDTCKRDMKACDISTDTWEVQAEDRTAWRRVVHQGVMEADKRRGEVAAEKRRQQKTVTVNAPQTTQHSCSVCNRVCKSRAGLLSHIRSHKRTPEAHR
ncbi:Hypp3363 [Branchiostoma lanceolatum]|uniref:Hypp3363 protein n=1 Tax=Branchiostoma lanceolatum TaxID=7740 RepID=A0A8K0A271_BRALA|nr:Hypp3363 [Branchiostoma lanceolatum]